MTGDARESKNLLWKVTAVQLCRQFERSLEQKSPILPESLLDYLPEVERQPLLFGLLQREIDHRRQNGETISRKDYDRRFPEDLLLLDALLDDDAHIDRVRRTLVGYDVIGRVGVSAFGEVFQVRQQSGGQYRCVRFLPAILLDPTHKGDLGTLDLHYMIHPNLARTLALFETEGDTLLLTEFVQGPTLADLVAKHHPIPRGIVCEIMRQAAAGLAQVHDHFRCHGDIRPQCFILHTQFQAVKVTGLGLSELLNLRYLRHTATPKGCRVPYSAFRAPELQTEPPVLDKASDVYSLGATLMAIAN